VPAAWVTTFALLLIAALAGCGGESFSEALARVASDAERPLQRLQRAVEQASARERSSLVSLRASSARVSRQLDDAQDELRTLDPESSDERRSVGDLDDAIDAAVRLAESLSNRRLDPNELESLAAETSAAIDDARTASLPKIDVASLVAGLRDEQRQRGGRRGTPSTPSAPPQSVPRPSYVEHSAFGYRTQVPSGAGWSAPSDSQPTPGRLFRTSVRGPSGMFLIIDYTPTEPATFGGRYESRADVGQTAFGSGTKYVFQGGRLPECQRVRCVDYIINDRASAQGFGVLAGGPDFALASEIARTAAESLTASAGE
jgi:hypothetical protein